MKGYGLPSVRGRLSGTQWIVIGAAIAAAVAYLWIVWTAAAGYPMRFVSTGLYAAPGVCASIVFARRARAAGAAAPAMRLVAAALATWVIGDGLYQVSSSGGWSVFPGPADAAYLAYYPLMLLALRRIASERAGPEHNVALLDAAVIGIAAFVILWMVGISDLVFSPATPLFARAVGIAYPAGDIALLFMLAVLLLLGRFRDVRALTLIGTAVFVVAVGDVVYAVAAPEGTYAAGALDLTWMGGYTLFALAALDRSIERLGDRLSIVPKGFEVGGRVGHLPALAVATILGPALALAVEIHGHEQTHGVVLAATSLAMILIVSARVGVTTHENEMLLERIDTDRRKLRGLVGRIDTARESERRRIASDIMDGPMQDLWALAYDLEVALRHVQQSSPADAQEVAAVREGMIVVSDRLRAALEPIRTSVLDDFGLVAGLRTFVERGRLLFAGRITFESGDLPRFEPAVERIVYSVAIEAMGNAMRHANAGRIEASLEFASGILSLTVIDDGDGFRPRPSDEELEQGHIGLVAMEERARALGGRLDIYTGPGAGTRVRLVVPVAKGVAA